MTHARPRSPNEREADYSARASANPCGSPENRDLLGFNAGTPPPRGCVPRLRAKAGLVAESQPRPGRADAAGRLSDEARDATGTGTDHPGSWFEVAGPIERPPVGRTTSMLEAQLIFGCGHDGRGVLDVEDQEVESLGVGGREISSPAVGIDDGREDAAEPPACRARIPELMSRSPRPLESVLYGVLGVGLLARQAPRERQQLRQLTLDPRLQLALAVSAVVGGCPVSVSDPVLRARRSHKTEVAQMSFVSFMRSAAGRGLQNRRRRRADRHRDRDRRDRRDDPRDRRCLCPWQPRRSTSAFSHRWSAWTSRATSALRVEPSRARRHVMTPRPVLSRRCRDAGRGTLSARRACSRAAS